MAKVFVQKRKCILSIVLFLFTLVPIFSKNPVYAIVQQVPVNEESHEDCGEKAFAKESDFLAVCRKAKFFIPHLRDEKRIQLYKNHIFIDGRKHVYADLSIPHKLLCAQILEHQNSLGDPDNTSTVSIFKIST